NMPSDGLTDRDAALLDRNGYHIKRLNIVLQMRLQTQSLSSFLTRGLVQLASVTPSDASHALGWATAWDRSAAEKSLRLFG
ncbi:MAG: hydantoinase/oxoprolinase family protein, partial [Paracoccaceae bacterium]|nr:hydantoinase/oxoprolinase family protein [Paracoccaceae bacterium]